MRRDDDQGELERVTEDQDYPSYTFTTDCLPRSRFYMTVDSSSWGDIVSTNTVRKSRSSPIF